jgi:hypothetical protein
MTGNGLPTAIVTHRAECFTLRNMQYHAVDRGMTPSSVSKWMRRTWISGRFAINRRWKMEKAVLVLGTIGANTKRACCTVLVCGGDLQVVGPKIHVVQRVGRPIDALADAIGRDRAVEKRAGHFVLENIERLLKDFCPFRLTA